MREGDRGPRPSNLEATSFFLLAPMLCYNTSRRDSGNQISDIFYLFLSSTDPFDGLYPFLQSNQVY